MGTTFTTGPSVFGLFAFGESADAAASFKSDMLKHFVFLESRNEKREDAAGLELTHTPVLLFCAYCNFQSSIVW